MSHIQYWQCFISHLLTVHFFSSVPWPVFWTPLSYCAVYHTDPYDCWDTENVDPCLPVCYTSIMVYRSQLRFIHHNIKYKIYVCMCVFNYYFLLIINARCNFVLYQTNAFQLLSKLKKGVQSFCAATLRLDVSESISNPIK